MKKDYSTKKKMTIAALSIVAVCLARGLFYYTGTMGGQAQEIPAESTAPVETQVVVPEINTGTTAKDTKDDDESVIVSPSKKIEEEQPDVKNEISAAPSANETQSQKNKKPSDGKPKSPKDVTPPAESPDEATTLTESPIEKETSVLAENTDKSGQSSKEKTSQADTKQDSGTSSSNSVYVPGFGNIEPSGSVEGSTSYTGGDWDKQIGEMK